MVFLFICLTIIIVIITFLIFSKLQIEIRNVKFNSQLKKHFNDDYQIIIKWYVLKWIPILNVNITKTKLEKMKLRQKIDFSVLEKNINLDKKIWNILKNSKIEIQKIELYMELGTENAAYTAMLIPIISTVLAFILRKNTKQFKIQPLYQNQNLVNIFVSGIFEIKMSHIISSIYFLNKKEGKGVKEYERTSNRKPYDYSYE